ncbi:MAG: hypothetical protein GY855_12075 [candidate division Zixibacteria bacterium]|nr:hypothetical protein [candidate division Zixibacteria bacterium]
MKKYLIFGVLVLYALYFLIISCDSNPTQSSSPYAQTVLANNLQIIDNIEGIDLYGFNPQGVYTFRVEDNYNLIQVGDIILGTAFDGYIRRVTRRSRDRNILELETEDATLVDAIKSGGIDTTLNLSIGDTPTGYNFKLISSAKGVSVSDQGLDLSGISLYSGVTEDVNVDIKLSDGFISFDPKVEYGFGIRSSALNHFHTFVSGILNYDYNLEITSDGKFDMAGLTNIADFQYTSIQMFDTLPLLQVVSLKLDIGFVISATIDGTFSYGTKAEYNIKAGGQFNGGSLAKTWTYDFSFEERPINWLSRSNKQVQTYIRPKVIVKYYTLTCSEISIEPYSNYNTAVDSFPSWCWTANNGIDGSYNFQYRLFSDQLPSHSGDFGQQEWPRGSDCENIEDHTPPSRIDDLTAGDSTSNSMTLFWTSPGDDNNTGKASEYDIRYSISPIDVSNWDQATKFSPPPNPQVAATSDEFIVTGLGPITKYYFALKVADEISNWSPMSNVATGTTGEIEDVIAPSAVLDLFAGTPTANSMTLTWTAPGDDQYIGQATQYEIKISTEYIDQYQWFRYAAIPHPPTPQISGSDEEFLVTNLVPNTIYYFAMKSADEVSNWSGMSNMAGERTAAADLRGNIIDEFTSPVTDYTLDLAATDTSIWIINQIGDTVYNVSLSDGSLLSKFSFAPATNANLSGVAFDGTNLWLATATNIHKVDPSDGTEIDHFSYINTVGSIAGLAWGDGKLWMAGPFADIAYEVDTEIALLDGDSDSSVTNQVIFSNPPSFRGISWFEDGLFIVSWTNSQSAMVTEYDPTTGEIQQQFQIYESDPMHNPLQGGLTNDGTNFYTGGDNYRILKIQY